MADVDVFDYGFEFLTIVQGFVEGFVFDRGCELAVCGEIGVATDWRGEVGVDIGRETVVAEFWVCLGAAAEVFGG